MTTIREPASSNDLRGLLLDYLDFYRDVIVAKASGLDDEAARTSKFPSGWTIAGLLNHLAFMERRWFRWGFEAEQVDEPWGDHPEDGWVTPPESVVDLADRLTTVGERTRQIVEANALDTRARIGGRFATVEDAPALHWILLHVLQEYARHTGHLDIARELIDGTVGDGD